MNDPPITSGVRRAQEHKTWLEDFASQFNLLLKIWGKEFGTEEAYGILCVEGFAAGGDTLEDSYKTVATATPGMTVQVKRGIGISLSYKGGRLFELTATWTSATLSAPSGNPRIDRVSVDPEDGAVTITTGVEAGSPSAPALPTNHLPLATIYHRVGEASIKDTDDASNGYITLGRLLLNYGGWE